MDKQLKLSIIIPVYNAEKHLSRCLDSLLEQGIPPEDYEIICINDGSRDASISILKEYAQKHPNIIVVDKENEGVSATRNKGLDMARGEYVWFIDADDWVAKDFLGTSGILRLFGQHCGRVSLLLTKCIDVYDNETDKYIDHRVTEEEVSYEETSPFMTTSRGHFFDRDLIESYQLRYDPNLAYGEDLMFMRQFLDFIRFEKENGADYRILQSTDKGIYLYRIHSESVMGQLRNRMEKVADSILYRARWSMERYRMENQPIWYRANYQEYVNLHMQEYMLYYFPALNKPMWAHLKELKKEGLYPAPPPKLGWDKPKGTIQKIQRFAFRYSVFYPLYYMVMRMKYKKVGSA